jgi:hypothetical protein
MSVVRNDIIFLNIHMNYTFAPQTEKLLPMNWKQETSFGVLHIMISNNSSIHLMSCLCTLLPQLPLPMCKLIF